MFSKKGPPGDGGLIPSDTQSREKLVLYVYEYLLHMGAKQAAATFLQEIHWDKNITTIQDPPGFLQSWWCVFWDLYCAAPERRDSHRYSTEAKTFHDFAFVNSGFSAAAAAAANGMQHGPNPSASPLVLAGQQLPDGLQQQQQQLQQQQQQASSSGVGGGMGPPPHHHHPNFFPPPPVPGPHMRPSPPHQQSPHHVVSQPSPHGMINQAAFINSTRYQGPGPNQRPGGPGGGPRLMGQQGPQDGPPPPFMPGGQPMMFPDQVRAAGVPPHLMPPQRLPPVVVSSQQLVRNVGPNGFPGMRPNMGPVMGGPGGGMPGGPPPHLQRSWSGSSAPPNGPGPGGPGTPVMRSPQSLPDGNGPERYGMMQQPGGGPMATFPLGPESSGMVGMREMLMNGDGMDIKHSPASTHGGLNGGTPGPGGPNSVPPSTSGESCSLDFVSAIHPFQSTASFDDLN